MLNYEVLKRGLGVFVTLVFLAQNVAWAEEFPVLKKSVKRTVKTVQDVEKVYDLEKYLAFKSFSSPAEDEEVKKARLADPRIQFEFIQKQLAAYEKTLKGASRKADTRRTRLVKQSPAEAGAGVQAELSRSFATQLPEEEASYAPVTPVKLDPAGMKNVCEFLRKNVTEGGMPLSYQVSPAGWEKWESAMDPVDSVMERLIVAHSLSIYDAAVWQIAMAITDYDAYREVIDNHTRRMMSGQSGDLQDIRAYDPFRYGDRRIRLERKNAYFFRIITDSYLQKDPKTGAESMPDFPNLTELHHEDWKPITGEQAWAAIIGPLQLAYIQYGGTIPVNCKEVELALSILPAIEAMRSKIGGIYHAPWETHGKEPNDISNENNFSMYAALKMLHEVVKEKKPGAAVRIRRILRKMEEYFKYYSFDTENGVFYQGGFYVNGRFIPTRIYAVDCQTWGLAVLGPEWIDQQFGDGTAYRIWQNTKARAGYFDRGMIRGVGFTDGHRILSVEWTGGAILAAKSLARYYETSRPDWSHECREDVASMRYGLEELKTALPDGSVAYWYANRRSFIPFGWWANPIPSIVSSAWVIMNDKEYDPFILGGGPDFEPIIPKHRPDYL